MFNVSKLIDLHDIELLTSKRVETDNDYEIEYRKWLQDELTKQPPSPSKDKRFFPVKQIPANNETKKNQTNNDRIIHACEFSQPSTTARYRHPITINLCSFRITKQPFRIRNLFTGRRMSILVAINLITTCWPQHKNLIMRFTFILMFR